MQMTDYGVFFGNHMIFYRSGEFILLLKKLKPQTKYP